MNKYDEKMRSLRAYYVQVGDPRLLTEKELVRIEDEIGFNLPDDYREFVSKFGCYGFDGYVTFSLKVPCHGGDGSGVQVFYGLLEGDAYDLLTTFDSYKDRIAIEALPIALDPYGNQICLILTGKYRGKIYFWDHEEELLDKSNLYLIADSFDEFITSLVFEEA